MREGKPNYSKLQSCPCDISCRGFACAGVTVVEVDDICVPKGWRKVWAIWTPFYLDKYHPGAWFELRSSKGPPYTQCTYDKNGKLITTGPGIGTVDEGYAPSGPHYMVRC